MKKVLLPIILCLCELHLYGKLVINEFTTANDIDWVELRLIDSDRQSLDISQLYVTMYYGTNEPLASEPVTIYSYDQPATSYDDRYIVIHYSTTAQADETDRTGDTNGNGYLDIYCDNYYASLWNSDGLVAIDYDDDPGNGGILDFVAYSNKDGSPNSTIASFVSDAAKHNEWNNGTSFQNHAVDIGDKGLKSFMSIARNSTADTNSADDFCVTGAATPGTPNICLNNKKNRRIFKLPIKKLFISGKHRVSHNRLKIFIYEQSNLTFRVFSSTGKLLDSTVYKETVPGPLTVNFHAFQKKYPRGLYIGFIEAVSKGMKKIESKKFVIIVGD